MILTTEKSDLLSKLLLENPEEAKKLLQMPPAEAVEAINSKGYDFTVEELISYGEAVKNAASQDELSIEELEDVAGGGFLTVCGAAAVALVAGAIVGGIEKFKIW